MISQIIEINQLLNSEEILQTYKRSQPEDKAKKQALTLAMQRWLVMPKASTDGWQHPQIPHLKMVIR